MPKPLFQPFCVALVLACAGHASSAQNADTLLSKQYAACMGQRTGTTTDMVDCITAETKRQDARLNQAYKAAMARQSPARQKQLQAVQRLWLKFRDANCEFYSDPDGGSLARISGNECMMNSTAHRARELEGFAPNQ